MKLSRKFIEDLMRSELKILAGPHDCNLIGKTLKTATFSQYKCKLIIWFLLSKSGIWKFFPKRFAPRTKVHQHRTNRPADHTLLQCLMPAYVMFLPLENVGAFVSLALLSDFAARGISMSLCHRSKHQCKSLLVHPLRPNVRSVPRTQAGKRGQRSPLSAFPVQVVLLTWMLTSVDLKAIRTSESLGLLARVASRLSRVAGSIYLFNHYPLSAGVHGLGHILISQKLLKWEVTWLGLE